MHQRLTKSALIAVLCCLAAWCCAQPVTIRFAVGSGGDNLTLIKKIVAEFEAAHPNIRVKVEPIPDNYENKLLSEYAANIPPDVAMINANRVVGFARRGALLDLGVFSDLQSAEVDLKGRYPNIVNAFNVDGKQFAIPLDIACSAYIYYNKKAFDEAGIPYPDGSWTWDTKVRPELREKDFVWAMQQLTKTKPGEKRPYQYGFTTSWPQLWMETLLISSNVKTWDSDANPTTLYLNDPQVVEIFQFAADTVNKHHWIPSNNDVTLGAGSSMQDEFRKGKIAMLQSGAWEVRDMRKKHKGEWDIAPFPRFARGSDAFLPGEGGGAAIFSKSEHPKEAWEWVKWYTGPHGLVPIAQSGETQPSIRSLAVEAGVWLPAADAKGVDRMPEHLSITDETALRVRYRQLPLWFAGTADTLSGSYYAVLTGERTAKDMLSSLQSDLPKKMELAKRRIDAPDYPFYPALIIGILLVAGLVAWVYLPERKSLRTRSEKSEARSAYLFLIPWILGLGLTVGPMIYSFFLSFAESDIIQTAKWRGVGNYSDLLTPSIDDTLFVSLKQTFVFSAVSIPLGIVAALGLALLLNQKVHGVPLFRTLFYIPSLASGVAMSLLWMKLFDRDSGLINALLYGSDGKGVAGMFLSGLAGTPGEPINWLGNTKTVIPAFVIMGLWGAGGGTIIFLAGLQGISQQYYEAATLDGAGIWKRFRNVTLPLLTPTLFFTTITGVIGALQVFSQAFVITDGGPDRATYFMMIWLYKKAFGELQMGYASAIAWILFTVILILTVAQFGVAKRWVHYEGSLK